VNVKISKPMTMQNSWPGAVARTILFVCMLGVCNQLLGQQAGQEAPQAAPAQSTSPQAQPTTPQTQTQPATQQTQAATPQTPTKPADDPGTVQSQPAPAAQAPENDRILFALPNYMTVERSSHLPPLTPGQKFKLEALGTFDPIQIAFIGGEALVYQADNTNPSFGQGLKGYGRRYGLAFGDNAIENFMVGAVFASAFRQDPRYYQMGKGKVLHRFGYAAVRIFVTRGDSGKTQFNFSELLGAGMAAGISNSYHPGPQNLGTAVSTWATQMGWDAVGYEMKEFWPDLHRFLLRGKHKNNM
jgi:hypothetical protein